MIRALVIALCLALGIGALAEAQNMPLTGAGGFKKGSAGATYTGPGDIVSGATAWWGLRAYSSAQADGTHKAINIKRISDNETCDVLLNTSGQLGNTTACSGADNGVSTVTFCNATTCVVLKWYDQTGNTNDVSVNAGGSGTPALIPSATIASQSVQFATNVPAYCTAGSVTLANTLSMSAVYQRDVATGTNDIGGYGTTPTQLGGTGAAQVFLYAGTQVNEAATDNAYHAFQWISAGASSAIYVDTTAFTGINVGTGAGAGKLCLGSGDSANGNAFHGFAREYGIWPNGSASSFSSAASGGSMNTNQHNYWGF